MPSSPPVSVPVLFGLFVGGVVLGLVGVGVISLTVTIGSVTVPWGVALAVLGVACTVRGSAWLVGSRRGGLAVLLGWFVPTLAFSALNPGGDVVLTDEPRTYVYLVAAFGLGLLGATWPLPAGAAELSVTRPRGLPDGDSDDEGYADGELDPPREDASDAQREDAASDLGVAAPEAAPEALADRD